MVVGDRPLLVVKYKRPHGGGVFLLWHSGFSFEERCRIEALAGEGSWSVAEIAVHVGRSEPTIRREFARCGGRGFYASGSAQADADRKAMRPKVPKLVSDPGSGSFRGGEFRFGQIGVFERRELVFGESVFFFSVVVGDCPGGRDSAVQRDSLDHLAILMGDGGGDECVTKPGEVSRGAVRAR